MPTAIESSDGHGDSGYRSDVEFVTVMTFDSLQNVIQFQGEDYERSQVPDVARAVLLRWDATAAHYEVQRGSSEWRSPAAIRVLTEAWEPSFSEADFGPVRSG
ncbi:MAG: hypothetical protein M8857_03845 [marine benthic group bacterium]|nr:hypothetical protein [Gemmatimonadota bacterium]